MEIKQVSGSTNFGTDFRIKAGNKKSERELALKIANAVQSTLADNPYNAKIYKVLENKGGHVIVRTSITKENIVKHVKELTNLRKLMDRLSLDGHPSENALKHINSCITSAGDSNEYHNRVLLDFHKHKSNAKIKNNVIATA